MGPSLVSEKSYLHNEDGVVDAKGGLKKVKPSDDASMRF